MLRPSKNFRRSAAAILFQVLAISCSLIITAVLTRSLSAEVFGKYVFVQSIIAIASIAFDAGLPHLVVREVATNDQDKKFSYVKGVLLRALQFITLFSTVLFGFWLFGAAFLSIDIADSESEAFLITIALIAVPFVAFLGVFSGALRAFQRYFSGLFLSLVAVRLVNLALLGLIVAVPAFGGLDAVTAMIVFVTSYVLAAISAATLLWLQPEYNWATIAPAYKTRDWIASLMPLTMIAGMQIIVTKSDIVMLRALSNVEDVGVYHIASQVGNLALVAKSGVMMVVGPRFARLYRDGKHDALQDELSSSARFVFFSAVPIVVTLILFGQPVLGILFGKQFVEAYPAMVVLSLGFLVLSLFGSIDTLFKMTNNEATLLGTIGLAIVINVGLNAVLIPIYGPLGAALATAIAMISWRLVLVQRAYRILNLISFAFYRKALSPDDLVTR